MLIEADYIEGRINVRQIPEGSYCNRCHCYVTNSSFRDRNYIDNYFVYKLCGKCQDIMFDDGKY